MSEFMDKERKKKTEKSSASSASAQTVQRDLSEVNGPQGGMLPDSVTAKIQSKRGTGQKLSEKQSQKYSAQFGRDMSDVHIHTDAESDMISRSLNARAFTIGSDVFLTKGINPDGGGRDEQTMTHELTHVVQQNGRAGFGSLKLGAADTAAEHEAQSQAMREFSPKYDEEDTIQRGFWGNLGKAIGQSAIKAFGMESVVNAFSDFLTGDQKVKAAIEKMEPDVKEDYEMVESKIKKIESSDLKSAEDHVAMRRKELKNAEKRQKKGDPNASAQANTARIATENASSNYESLKNQYMSLLNLQVKLLKKADPTITKDDINKYRSGKAKTFFSAMFASVGGSILGSFEKDPEKKAKAQEQGMKDINSWFASKNKAVADVEEETGPDEETKAREAQLRQQNLIAEVWQSVQEDEHLKAYYRSWLLFKRNIARDEGDFIQQSIKDGEQDSEIKTAIVEELKQKADSAAGDSKAKSTPQPSPAS